jgi:pSer/pThr/pTyr-binding forkhead associated (FHA) protein
MDVALVMFRPNGRHRTFKITKPVSVVGRREDCDLRIPLGEVSRKHCRLKIDAAGVQIVDLGSSNGTYVNGRRITEEDVDAGDTIKIGSLAFIVQVNGEPATEGLAAPTDEAPGSTELSELSPENALMPTAAAEAGDAGTSDDGLQFFDDDDEIASADSMIDMDLPTNRPDRPA